MKASALAISMILILVPLAGCSGTDTEVTVDMDSEDLQAIIDDNRDDFLNNTTVVVFQEFHNNTSVVNQYSNNSTSNVDQSGASSSTTTYNYNSSGFESEMFVLRLDWDFSSFFEEIEIKRNNNFTVNYSYYDYATNDDRDDEFTLQCSNYYDVIVPNSGNGTGAVDPYWENNDYYWDWWDAIYNNTIRDLLQDKAYSDSVTSSCRQDDYDHRLIDGSDYSLGDGEYDYSNAPIFFEMDLPNGTAIKVIQISASHSFSYPESWGGSHQHKELAWTINGIHQNGCNDSGSIVNWQSCGGIYGGWSDIHFEFQVTESVWMDSEFSFMMYYELVPVSHS
jgi:hypothetical protein